MPDTTVAAIVITRDNNGPKVLMTLRGVQPYEGYWCLPGGHIDRNETAERAVIREVKEETGLDFQLRLFRCFDEIVPIHVHHAVVFVFEGYASGTPTPQEPEVKKLEWFYIYEARSMSLAYTHNEILDAYVSRNLDPSIIQEILAEHSALRAEIVSRTELKHRLLFWTLAIAGSFIAAGVEEIVKPLVLLTYPVFNDVSRRSMDTV